MAHTGGGHLGLSLRDALLLDMNLPPSVANWLRSEGHDALHVRDLGLSGAPDSEIFARAAADGRIVVSFDLDFGEVAGLLIPNPADQNPWAQSRRPIDMMVQG